MHTELWSAHALLRRCPKAGVRSISPWPNLRRFPILKTTKRSRRRVTPMPTCGTAFGSLPSRPTGISPLLDLCRLLRPPRHRHRHLSRTSPLSPGLALSLDRLRPTCLPSLYRSRPSHQRRLASPFPRPVLRLLASAARVPHLQKSRISALRDMIRSHRIDRIADLDGSGLPRRPLQDTKASNRRDRAGRRNIDRT